MPASLVVGTPLFGFAFETLKREDDTFDDAVDAVVELIHETQEIGDNAAVIEQIVPRLVDLRPLVSSAKEDTDRIRGFARVFAEAGEWYAVLITKHVSTFLPIVEALVECAACEDLDVVRITFGFWRRLTGILLKASADASSVQPLIQIYHRLVDIIIGHLRYPADDSEFTAEERDDFRDFRHVIGDTLKDCCQILGPTVCLRRAYELVARASSEGGSWQDIEGPLFAMRSMGAEADQTDEEVLPLVMEAIPKLPQHPKIRYAAILVISRYTQWIARHPDQIVAQLSFVSSGFSDQDQEVWLASADAMKWLCRDCRAVRVLALGQSFTFIG
jgi:transportin-3